jgi:hypothetical protein
MRAAKSSANEGIMEQEARLGSPKPGEPEQPVPWYKLDPWQALDPCCETEEPEPPGIPVALGPGSGGGGLTPDPSLAPGTGIDASTSLAAGLNWKVSKSPT